jgi:hypothetical protein
VEQPQPVASRGASPLPSGTLRWKVLLVLPVIVVLLVGLVAWRFFGHTPSQPPDQIHLSFRGDPHTSFAVSWHAATDAPGSVKILEDTGSRVFPGKPTDDQPIGSGVWREADVTGLRPGTTYRYVITSGDAQTDEFQFKTEPLGAHPVRFDVFGDQGDCTHHPGACRVMDGIAADRPDFVLAAGDLTYANDNGPDAWDLWVNDVMRRYGTWAPLMPAVGNHEYLAPDNIGNYKGRFALPEKGGNGAPPGRARDDYYSFNYGSVHVVALPERYVNMKANSEFRRWLVDDLRDACQNPAIRWRVALNHRPFYSTGRRHGSDWTYQNYVAPVLEQYRVDLVFSGHEHTYERSLQIRDGKPVTRKLSSWRKGAGTAYIVTGGGGAPTYNDFGPEAPWDAVRKTGHHHVRVDVGVDDTLRLTTISDTVGQHHPIDQVVIRGDGRIAACGKGK